MEPYSWLPRWPYLLLSTLIGMFIISLSLFSSISIEDDSFWESLYGDGEDNCV